MNKKRLKKTETKLNNIILICIALIACCIWVFLYFDSYVSSENAVIEGKLLSVSSKIAGQIRHIYASEDLEVKKGDLIIELDTSFYEYKLREAENGLRELRIKYPDLSKTDSEKRDYFSKFKFPHNGFFKDYSRMYDEGINSEQDVENSKKYLTSKVSDHTTISDTKPSVEDNTKKEEDNTLKEEKPEDIKTKIKRLEADIEQGKLNLSNTKVHVPQDGTVSVITVREGEYIYAGQPLISIIPSRVWVNAKLIEPQGKTIEPGQPVIVKVKKYPTRRFKGVVESVQRNNTDNCVSVRIMFTEDYSDYNLTPSTHVKVMVKVK